MLSLDQLLERIKAAPPGKAAQRDIFNALGIAWRYLSIDDEWIQVPRAVVRAIGQKIAGNRAWSREESGRRKNVGTSRHEEWRRLGGVKRSVSADLTAFAAAMLVHKDLKRAGRLSPNPKTGKESPTVATIAKVLQKSWHSRS